MANFPPDISREVTIVVRAQQIVNRWRAARDRHPFELVLQHGLHQPEDGFVERDNHRQAIQRVAEAIRAGVGHAFRNPEPLVRIARTAIQHRGGTEPARDPH